MGIRRKVFYPVAFSAMLFASSAMAKVNPTAFVGVTEFFLKDKAKNIDMGFYDPTLGEVALESGLIENIRFYGAYQAGFNKEGERDYTKDTSTDPLWNIAKILFPSNNGQLGTITDAVTNFAKYVKNPKTVALLVNYAKRVEDVKGRGSLPTKVTQQFSGEIYKTLEGMGEGKESIKNFKQKTLNPLLNSIRESIEAEKKGTSLYPRHTTEQVIEAFFCYHFNTQEDIWKLLEDLDGSIVDKNKPLPTQTHYLEEKDLPAIAAKEALNLGDLFDLTQATLFNSLTPYKAGINLLNNGTTHFYDRDHNAYVRDKTFQDCVETAGRHISNLLTFNPITREFDLKAVEDFVTTAEVWSGVKNPYFDNFTAFYEKQTFLMANAGDIGVRSLWNTVVGNLPKTTYCREGTNEIKSGFINLLNTFDTLFSLSLPPSPITGLHTKKMWVEASLATLFSALNPAYSYVIDFNAAESVDELIGNALVTVGNRANTKDLFSFNLHVKPNHTEINQLKNLEKQNAADYTNDIATHLNSLAGGTAEESLLLLTSPGLQQNVHPLYKLYSQPLFDNATKINFLKKLGDNYESWKRLPFFQNNLPLIQSMTENVMSSIGWEDDYVKRNIGPALYSLAQSADFQGSLKRVKQLDLTCSSITKVAGLENILNLEELDLGGTWRLNTIDFSTPLNNLKKIQLQNSGIKTLTLGNLPSLEELIAGDTQNLTELSFTETSGKLKSILLNGSAISTLDGLENLPHVEVLGLANMRNLSALTLTQQQENLEMLNLSGSGISTLTGLGYAKKLRELDLIEMPNLTTVGFEAPLESLEILDLSRSGISTLTGLGFTKNLKELYLENAVNLTHLKVEKDSKDLVLRLSGSGIRSRDDIEGFEHLDPSNVYF